MEQTKIIEYLLEKHPNLNEKYLHQITDVFFRTIALELKKGKRVEIRGFGVFKIKDLGERQIFNPLIGALKKVAGKKIPNFKCSKKLHELT
jgi:integration host factor subunit beta